MKIHLEFHEIIEIKRDKVLREIEPILKRRIMTIPESFREDVEQEVRLKLFLSVDNVDFEKVPGIISFIELINSKGG